MNRCLARLLGRCCGCRDCQREEWKEVPVLAVQGRTAYTTEGQVRLAQGNNPRPGGTVLVTAPPQGWTGQTRVPLSAGHTPQSRRKSWTPPDEPVVAIPSWDSPQRPGLWGGAWVPSVEQAEKPPARFTHEDLAPPDDSGPPMPGDSGPPPAAGGPRPPGFQLNDGSLGAVGGTQLEITPGVQARAISQELPAPEGGSTTEEQLREAITALGDETMWMDFVTPLLTDEWTQVDSKSWQVRLNGFEPVASFEDSLRTWERRTVTTRPDGSEEIQTESLNGSADRRITLRASTVLVRGGPDNAPEQQAVLYAEHYTDPSWGAIPHFRLCTDVKERRMYDGTTYLATVQLVFGRIYSDTDPHAYRRAVEYAAEARQYDQDVLYDGLVEALPAPEEPPLPPLLTWTAPDGSGKAEGVFDDLGILIGWTLTAYGQTLACETWAALRDTDDQPVYLAQQGGAITAVRPSGTETVPEAELSALLGGPVEALLPTGQGSHSWPPEWAWVQSGQEVRAVTAWDPWRDSIQSEWPGRPRRRPTGPPAQPPPRPPLGLTLATTAPEVGPEERMKKGQAPAHLPASVQVQRGGSWQPSAPALKALAKRLLFRPAGWPEELDDRTSVRAPVRVAWAGEPLEGEGRCAYLLRAKISQGQTPQISVPGAEGSLYPLGRNAGERGWQPYLLLTDTPYPPTTTELHSDVPLSRLLLTLIPNPPENGPEEPGDPGSS